MIKNYLLLIVCWLSFTTVRAITLDECRSLARENYPLIRAAALNDLTADYTIERASKAWLPRISLGVTGGWQNETAQYPGILADMLSSQGMNMKGMSKWQYKGAIEVEQTLWDGGRVAATKRTIADETKEKNLLNDAEIYRMLDKVDELFFACLLLDGQAGTIQAKIDRLTAHLKTMNDLQEEGVAMASDVDALRAALLEAEQQKEHIKAVKKNYKSLLGLYIGRTDFSEPETPALPDSDRTNRRLELAAFDAQKITLESRMKEIDKGIMPRFSFFGNAFYGYPGLNFMDAMTTRKPDFGLQVGLSLSWNISSLYTRNADKNKLRSLSDLVELNRETFLFQNRLQTKAAENELSRIESLKKRDEEIVTLRKNVREAEEAKLSEGIINSTQLIDKITEEQEARIAAATRHIEYIQATYKLSRTLGQ